MGNRKIVFTALFWFLSIQVQVLERHDHQAEMDGSNQPSVSATAGTLMLKYHLRIPCIMLTAVDCPF
jgi:hypothetical protein